MSEGTTLYPSANGWLPVSGDTGPGASKHPSFFGYSSPHEYFHEVAGALQRSGADEALVNAASASWSAMAVSLADFKASYSDGLNGFSLNAYVPSDEWSQFSCIAPSDDATLLGGVKEVALRSQRLIAERSCGRCGTRPNMSGHLVPSLRRRCSGPKLARPTRQWREFGPSKSSPS